MNAAGHTGTRSRVLACAIACAVMAGIPAAAAAVAPPAPTLLPPPALARVDADIAELRAALGSASYGSRVAALSEAATSTATPPAASRSPALLQPNQLPTELRRPIAGLTAAVHAAWSLLDAPGVERRGAESSDAAAAIVAAALDRHLPSLRTHAAHHDRRADAAPCDLADAAPLLCIASAANQTHTADVALLVDLGGNDTYRNSAGGAPFMPVNGAPGVPISINVDLGGDDEYRPVGRKGAVLANGAADAGALGMLIDIAGDDRYLAEATAPAGLVVAQGAAVGGTGLLFDEAGNDTYAVSGTATTVVAQGAGSTCAVINDVSTPHVGAGCSTAGLLDRGPGTDTYEIQPSVVGPGENRTVMAQGYGNLGTGVLLDQGGPGTLSVDLTSGPGATGAPAADPPTLAVTAQGVAMVGSRALVLTGEGDTVYDISVRSAGRAVDRVWGQAVAHSGGLAVLDDAGGDDRYSVSVAMTDERHVTVDATCSCQRAQATVQGQPPGVIFSVEALAQGVGESNGTAVVHDRAGGDVYTVMGQQHLQATLHDRVPEPSQAAHLTVTSLLSPTVRAQGAARDGTGILADDGGRDRYTLSTENATTADVRTEPEAPGLPSVVLVGSDSAGVAGQGATLSSGTAALLDLGGSGDVVQARSSVPLHSQTAGAEVYRAGTGWPEVQGSMNGVLAVLGDAPVVTSSPSRPVCRTSQGRRGFGQWQDCAASSDDPETQGQSGISTLRHYSGGLTPGAAGSVPTLTFDSATPPAATVAVLAGGGPPPPGTALLPISAALIGADGKPLAGQRVRFDLQRGCRVLCALTPAAADASGTYWDGTWATEATTDADGRVRTALPLTLTSQQWSASTPYLWRVYATFDGAAGVQPRHVAKPLTLTPAPQP